jgi:hypothetical protein
MREHSQIEDMRAALRGDIERARQRGEPVFQAIVEPEAEPAAVEELEPEPEPVLDAAPEPEPVPQEPEPAVEPPQAALEEEPRPRSGLFAFFRKR